MDHKKNPFFMNDKELGNFLRNSNPINLNFVVKELLLYYITHDKLQNVTIKRMSLNEDLAEPTLT